MGEANHDLILYLDEPAGVWSGAFIYRQISFFECEAVEVWVGRVLFLG